MYTLANAHPLYQQLMDSAPALYDRLVQRADRDGKNWAARIDKDTAIARVRAILSNEDDGVTAAILADTHLLFVSVGRMWWSDKPWLIEQWYMRVAPGRSDPMAAIDKMAADLGCYAVGFGTSLAPNDRALGRLLERSGYRLESTQYIKDLAWHSPPQQS